MTEMLFCRNQKCKNNMNNVEECVYASITLDEDGKCTDFEEKEDD